MKKILVKLKEFWQRKTIGAAILRILIILLTLLVAGYCITTPFMLRELGLIGAPSTVKGAYNDARTRFAGDVFQRVGVRKCLKSTEQLYVVFWSTGFVGASEIYNDSGEKLGVNTWDDMARKTTEVDLSGFDCKQIVPVPMPK